MHKKLLYFKKGLLVLIALVCASANVATVHAAVPTPNDQNAINLEAPFYDPNFVDQSCTGTVPPGGSVGGAAGSTAAANVEAFVDKYGKQAFDVGKKNGIPYEAILAQAILESSYGKSQLTQQANNFFGIKAGSSWTGPTVTKRTAEQKPDGSVYYVDAAFRAYPSAEAGFQGYADFIRGSDRYKKALAYPGDPVKYIQAIKDAGYATDVSYVQKNVTIQEKVKSYIASKNLFPPSSQVVPDVAATTPGVAAPNVCSSAAAAGAGGSVVQVAMAEQAAWKKGSDYHKYTLGGSGNWCAWFVSWVFKQAGRPMIAPPNVGQVQGWSISSVDNIKAYMVGKNAFNAKANAPAPKPGDIVIYKEGMSHTNIVVWSDGYMVKTIGGNQASNDINASSVTISPAVDIRNLSGVTGWGTLP